MSNLLQQKLSVVRGRYRFLAVGAGTFWALAAFITALGVGALLDWWLDLPRVIRAAWLAINLSLVGYVLFRRMVVPLWISPDDDAIALRVEERHPKFASRLIAAVQLSRPQAALDGGSIAFVRATVLEAEALAAEVDFPQVLPNKPLQHALMAASLAMVVWCGGMIGGWKNHVSRDLLARAFLSNIPVPRKTHIEVTSGSMRLGRGDTATLSALAGGVIPAGGSVEIRFASGRRQFFALDPMQNDRVHFSRLLENVQDSFDYRVSLGDAVSGWFHAEVLARPMVMQLEVRQIFPAYTKQQPIARSLGDLSILSGSRLQLKLTSNNALQPGGSTVHLVNATTMPAVPVWVDANDPHQATVDLGLPLGTSGFSIHLRDTDGLSNRDPAVYRVDLVPDKPPTVRITYPLRPEELVTRIATQPIGFDAADDFGIARMSLHYKVDQGPEQTVPLETGDQQPRTLHNRYDWKIARVIPASTTQPSLEGSTIEYWLEAQDNNDATGPGIGVSDHYAVKVVSEAEKRAELIARLTASIDDVGKGLEDEQKLKNDLGDAILERKTP